MNDYSMAALLNDLPQQGRVCWIGIRTARGAAMLHREEIEVCTSAGIVDDRYAGSSGTRHVTLIQHEHLAVIASVLGVASVEPAELRRNLVVHGINLLALKGKRFRVGSAVLDYTGQCHPCSAMQRAFGPGGYNAVRGHGGITARVVESGVIRLNDRVTALTD